MTDAAYWLNTLRDQFPTLIDELAPAGRSASTPRGMPGPATPSRTTVPLRLHVSDAIRDITDGVVELEEAVRDKLGLGRAGQAPVPVRIGRMAALLAQVAAHPLLAEHVRDEARRMARRCSRALGGSEPMLTAAGRCPWCDSVSLRVFPERGSTLCINPGCRCDRADCDCGTNPAQRHEWPLAQNPEVSR
ncbi:hypothetical protein ACFQLX_02740 [Streptomyces polyrhachis]|uniref:Uncharacterized protein n=1 Tax=Streptomyces polyrhachis TaxID=1282885 RepID=A0ABW2GCU3_9ACTN